MTLQSSSRSREAVQGRALAGPMPCAVCLLHLMAAFFVKAGVSVRNSMCCAWRIFATLFCRRRVVVWCWWLQCARTPLRWAPLQSESMRSAACKKHLHLWLSAVVSTNGFTVHVALAKFVVWIWGAGLCH